MLEGDAKDRANTGKERGGGGMEQTTMVVKTGRRKCEQRRRHKAADTGHGTKHASRKREGGEVTTSVRAGE
jgi:hypothetical protein